MSTEATILTHEAGDWLERGSALLDPVQRIRQIDERLCRWLGRDAESLRDTDGVAVLGHRCAEIGQQLASLLETGAPFAEAVVVCRGKIRTQWFRIETTTFSGGWTVRLQSILPPEIELAESGWNEKLGGAFERDELFLHLLRAQEQLHQLARCWPGVIFTQRPDFSFQYVSPQIEKLTGLASEQWTRSPALFWEMIHEADLEELQQHLKRTGEGREPGEIRFRIRHARTGRMAYILEHRRGLRSANGSLLSFEGVWLDITQPMIAEKRLSAAAWKETLASLTMGLTHDFNNLLAGILSLTESFLAETDPGHPFAEGLELTRQYSARAGQLVHRIMILHRSKTGECNYHNLNEIITESADLLETILPRRIAIAKQPSAESLAIYADSVELRQVVLNLALNAADAMSDRGQLTLRTSRHEIWTQPVSFVGTVPRLPCVCFEIADTGCGIPARHLPLLFDAFFTTKPVNKGSGLGLHNVRLAVEKHHGGISVQSIEGQGTTFRVWLPEADFTEAERAENVVAPCRSLLVLGEAGLLLERTTELLRCHGCYVVKASTIDQARVLLAEEENNFALLMVIADVGTPGVRDFPTEVKRCQRELKIVLQIIGGIADDVRSELTTACDLTLTPEMSELDILKHLDELLRRG